MKGTIALAGCLAACALPVAADEPKKAADNIQGSYGFVSRVIEGKDDPGAKADTCTFEADKLTLRTGKVTQESAYKLDPTQDPKTIDIVPGDGRHKGMTIKGIYKLDGDMLTVCWAREPDKDRPKEFASKPGSGVVLATLKRQKD